MVVRIDILKLWLLNVLACPICKHHPLILTMFEYDKEDRVGKVTKVDRDILMEEINKGIIHPEAFGEKSIYHYDVHIDYSIEKEVKKALDTGKITPKPAKSLLYIFDLNVHTGMFECSNCKRWYPIGIHVRGVPELMPDFLREEEEEKEWLKKYESYRKVR